MIKITFEDALKLSYPTIENGEVNIWLEKQKTPIGKSFNYYSYGTTWYASSNPDRYVSSMPSELKKLMGNLRKKYDGENVTVHIEIEDYEDIIYQVEEKLNSIKMKGHYTRVPSKKSCLVKVNFRGMI